MIEMIEMMPLPKLKHKNEHNPPTLIQKVQTLPGSSSRSSSLSSSSSRSGVPLDEYQPEAELAFALACGCDKTKDLWDVLPMSVHEDVSDATLMSYLHTSFKTLFEQDVELNNVLAQDFRAALECAVTRETS